MKFTLGKALQKFDKDEKREVDKLEMAVRSITPTTQEAEIGEWQFQTQPGQLSDRETLSQKIKN